MSSLRSPHFQVVNLFCAKSEYEVKLASASAPSNVGYFRSALVVGCFVAVTAVEGKAEKAVNFTCTTLAVGGLGAIRLDLDMEQFFSILWWRQYYRLLLCERQDRSIRICFLKASVLVLHGKTLNVS